MAIAGVILGALGALGLVLTLVIGWLRRPRLRVAAATWQPSGPTPWWFAVAHVSNRPLPAILRSVLVRQSAAGCEITLRFREAGQDMPSLPDVAARWSANREPITLIPASTSAGAISYAGTYDPTLVPETLRFDVPPSGVGFEVAAAIIRQNDSKAFIFGAESYAHPTFGNPAWELARKIYDVDIIATSAGITAVGQLRLDNRSATYANFVLTERP